MKWNLETLYADLESWQEDYEQCRKDIERLREYEGTLHEFDAFRRYFELHRKTSIRLNRLFQYAHLKSDLDKKNVENAARVQKMQHLISEYSQATAFESPELLKLGEETVFSFLKQDEQLKEYTFPMKKLFHQSQHILDEKSERLLTHYQQLASQGSELHGALSVADNASEEITLKSGETITVTSGNFRSHLADLQDPDDREQVFRTIYRHYDGHKHTFAQIYNTVLEADKALMQARGYDSTLEAFLHKNAIDPVVFKNLIEVAQDSVKPIKRYYQLRKEALGLEKHRTFDRFLPLAEGTSKFEYEEAKTLFYNAVDTLGDEEFGEKARDALKEGFVDVFEQDGKQTGAYSSSALDEHPFILLNFDRTLGDVFTVAHEAGHSMHSLFSMEHQPVPTQNYTIFVAEVASTFNEHLLLDYFIENNKGSREDRIQLLQQSIDDILATFYRQTLFAAYEREAHRLKEQGEPITYETLSKIMVDLYQHFYDIDITEEPGKQYVWAYIPHFFFAPYYVYQYATSFAASLKLYDRVKNDPSALRDHLGLLKSGGDDFPVEQLRRAGVDLTEREAFEGVVSRLKELIDELEVALQG